MTLPPARHVVIVGLMGAGKSTVGRRVASLLQRAFVDADLALEEITDRTIADIFATEGESAFRAIEADVLEELLEHHEPTVIAAGGGVVLREDSRARLEHPNVTTVWLDASPAFLASRIAPRSHRPLLDGADTPAEVLERLHAERAPLYAQVADAVIPVEPFHRDDEGSKGELAEQIAALVVAREEQVA